MKISQVTLCLATVALGIASAASSYNVVLPSDTTIGNTQLKAGEYKLTVEGSNAVFKQGKKTTQVPVSVEQNDSKFRYTAVETVDSKVKQIDLGGTNTKLVVSPSKSNGSVPAGGGQ